MKKEQKEREGIPIWSDKQILKLCNAIKVVGIGNWYEVACRVNVPDKTPFYCYTKYTEMIKNGEWDTYFTEPETLIFEEEDIDEEAAAEYINELVISCKKQEMENLGIRVKQEVITPPPLSNNIKMEIPDDIPASTISNLTQREKDLMRHFYLETIASMEEKHLKELLEKHYESDESEIPEDPIVEPPINEASAPPSQPPATTFKAPKEEEDSESDIQVIQVVPPKKRQTFGGSLTQGTPRPSHGIVKEQTVLPPQPPTLNISSIPLAHDPKNYEEQFRNFQENQLKELLVPRTNSQTLLFDNDFKGFFPPVSTIQRNEGISSGSSSITPIDQTATTTAPPILNFFTADVNKIREVIYITFFLFHSAKECTHLFSSLFFSHHYLQIFLNLLHRKIH